MEQLGDIGPQFLNNVLYTGYKGIKCIECGGPEPGIGCAGRGVIRMVDLLRDHGLNTDEFDYVFFDVLGDVVCGGFAVPMRDGYASEVYIVTSGEYASIYAANNIARGLKRFSATRGKLAGVIGNERGTKRERELIINFARMIGTEMTAFIPRSELILEAELSLKTVIEYAPDSGLANAFRSLADAIESNQKATMPTPVAEDELEDYVSEYIFGSKPVRHPASPPSSLHSPKNVAEPVKVLKKENEARPLTKSDGDCAKRKPVYGCALAGAYTVISQIKDAVAIMDSPRGCAFTCLCIDVGAASVLDRDETVPPNLLCINMSDRDAVFGSERSLEESVLGVSRRISPKAVFLITSCPSGIIGNDILGIAERLRSENIDAVPVATDGVIGGDFYTGMATAYNIVAEHFIDDRVEAQGNSVNLIGEQSLSTVTDRNYAELEKIIHGLGLKINCRFVRNASVEQLRNFKRATLNIPVGEGPVVGELIDRFRSRYGVDKADLPLPYAFQQTSEFTRILSSKFGKEKEGEKIISQARIRYESELAKLKSRFSGKKVLVSSYTNNIDWLISTLLDLDVKVQKVCLFGTPYYKSRFSSEYGGKNEMEFGCTMERFDRYIAEIKPDLVLANTEPKRIAHNVQYGVFPASPAQGFLSGIEYARRWASNFSVPFTEGWRYDRELLAGSL